MSVPGEDVTADSRWLFERYLPQQSSMGPLRAYYAVKPLMPRPVQLMLRRRLARRRARSELPRWPIEDRLLRERTARVSAQLASSGADRIPFVNFWPDRKRFAFVLTHDVEGPVGVQKLPEVLEVEKRHGLVSSWNFVAEWYPLGKEPLETVREAGGEVGLHGIRHDGSLFRDRPQFEEQLPKIRHYLDQFGAVGFRSPSTIRNADWMHELPCLYDSSFPMNDPFQPQPGGCCSIFPFFFGEVVELPITLDQDHTLFELLRVDSIELWLNKARWLADNHGLVNVIVHPDYMNDERLARYDELLGFLTSLEGGWHALPADVAHWWRARSRLTCGADGGTPRIAGPPVEGATVAWARPEDGRLRYDI